MFIWWAGVTVHTVVDILWYIGLAARPPTKTSPNISLPQPSPPLQAVLDDSSPITDPSVQSSNTARPELPMPPQLIPIPSRSARLYALVIGINDYSHIPKLRGAVADASAMESFLRTTVGVAQHRIKNLRDDQATRKNIRDALLSLATCDDIEHGDPILIYFAGHGAQANTPDSWAPRGETRKIPMILPYDFVSITTTSEDEQGIPHISVNAILSQLANAKGDNITLILDTCYSGGAQENVNDMSLDTRSVDSHEGLSSVTRGIDLPDDYAILPTLDDDLRASHTSAASVSAECSMPTRGRVSERYEKSDTTSHILLAGCGEGQLCVEDNSGGRFSKALLDVLVSDGTDRMTYEQLVNRLPLLPDQNPQCEGVNKSRVIFNNMAPSSRRVLLCISESPGGHYELKAGEAYGITRGARFDIYADKKPKSACLGSLIADSTTAFTSQLRLGTRDPPFKLPYPEAYALQTHVGEQPDLRVLIADDDELLGVYERLKLEMDKSRKDGKRGFVAVQDGPYDVSVMKQGSRVTFGITDKFCVDRGLATMFHHVECDANAIFEVLNGAADFFYRLRRTSSDRKFTQTNAVSLECYEVTESGKFDDNLYPLLARTGQNLVTHGSINVVVGAQRYGFKIVNRSDYPLYAALFYFDMSDLSISSYYQPPAACNEHGEFVPDLPAKGSLVIGYGPGAHPPRRYFLRENQELDVGFLKLFISTDRVDLSHMPQPSPFMRLRNDAPGAPPNRLRLWDSIQVGIVQRAPKRVI